MKVAFIGLGNVGYPLARNLLKAGHELTVHDLDRERAAGLLAEGAVWAGSIAEAAADAQAAVTSLPNPRAVAAVVPGDTGLLASLPRGALWIEMSTTDDAEMKAHAQAAVDLGLAVVEAPITGGANRAWTGEISILVGGEEADVARAMPLLQIMGGEIEHMGPIGAASVVKVITNMLAFVHLLASGEALMLAKRAGVDLAKAYHGIRISSGNSFAHETEGQLVLNGSYNCAFTMDLALKDMNLTLDLARDTATPLPLAELTGALFEEARKRYGDKAWSTEAVRLLEDRLGVELRAAGFPEVLPGMEPALEKRQN
ncbi:NAD(P)-dependent oxidoreductase [Limibacillus halophilus]|uniref:3-hydroxyisobutyrate dehydrogenase n=1 Tax=Limibacillus halophilus TaxID=1579333 RepID=A0A839SV20_9PROT|nr:NAD(P)-dependent oxidoreductase [Limibacillus halophilus]MBB3065296.1 3-hydroxyisobutyrate dehydrogenase [Limibacillus halophilus]